jgi:siderophore synthetase component
MQEPELSPCRPELLHTVTMGTDETDAGQTELARPRTDAERDALAAATDYSSVHDRSEPPETFYLAALGRARRDITRRFVRGLLRGNPTGLPDHRIVASDAPTVPDDPDPLSNLSGERLRSVVEPLHEACEDLALLSFPASDTVVIAPITDVHGYDRFRLAGPIRRVPPGAAPDEDGDSVAPAGSDGPVAPAGGDATDTPDDGDAPRALGDGDASDAASTVEHPVDLVPLLAAEGAFVNGDQADRIRAELAESVANLALAQLAGPVHAEAVNSTHGSVLDAIASGVPAADATAAFERIVTDGHPFHPAGKIRRGMTATDGLSYAPEFTDRIDLRFVAVRRDYAREVQVAGSDRLTGRLRSTFGGLEAALERTLPEGGDLAEYAVIPVHPWQYHHTLPELYAGQRADGRVVPIPDYTYPATPQLNLRTVVPYDTESAESPESLKSAESPDATDASGATDAPLTTDAIDTTGASASTTTSDPTGAQPPHLKLAIDVQTTNVVRTLSPHAVTNGPQITEVVEAIDAAASFERLGLLAEPAATCYYPPGGPHLDGEQRRGADQSSGQGPRDGVPFDEARNLSALVRANPHAHPLVPDGATPVVASSLLADVPSTGRPLVCELIGEYAAATETTSTATAALEFVDAYADVVISEQLHLLSTYGIALESHLQNSIVVFDGVSPVATLVRDFGGIRVHRGRLADHGLSIEPYPNSDAAADGEEDLYRKLYYSLFQNHVAELVATVSHELGVPESACWARIRERCERAFDTIRSDSGVPESRIRRDERALFDDPAVHKALTAMRLRGKRHEYVTSRVSNPLAGTNDAGD